MRCISLLFCVAFATAAQVAHAHSLGQSVSSWRMQGETLDVTFTLSLATVERVGRLLESTDQSVVSSLVDHLHEKFALQSAVGCELVDGPRENISRASGFMEVRWTWRCAGLEVLEIRNEAFFSLDPVHTHIARVSLGERGVLERLITASNRGWSISLVSDEMRSSGFTSYFRLGVEHIATGYDHLAFLCAVLLAVVVAHGGGLRDVVFVVSGFTLGHSLTLALGVLGWVRPSAPAIEGLIGFTIALVCVELLVSRGGESRARMGVGLTLLGCAIVAAFVGSAISWWGLLALALFSGCYLSLLARAGNRARRYHGGVTVLFGLIHGFGFAGVLLQAELPADRLVAALLGFNLGVEAGQVIIVGAMVVLARVLAPNARLAEQPAAIACGLLCGLGTYWFVVRIFA